ncbi:universal stress protein [Thiocystis violacea]|uniref:universal stress protein n=1 Tax=Thiocystis violacea TaxID=13725 RepID=UPI0019064739|nr:universal stress protein [Thiocystis violacea]MBK1717097.1 hypothetical protein [Thiocystis violacea]
MHQEIRDLAEALNVDLILMGRRGRRGLARMRLGSISERILNDTPRAEPVIKTG